MTALDEAVAVRVDGASDHGCRRRVFAAHDLLFREHDVVRRVYLVEEGLVMLHHVFRDGRRQIVDIVGPGELCSWEEGPVHNCSAEALTSCTILSYDLPRVEAAPELQRDLSRRMRAAVLRLQNHAALLGRKTSLERVASLLRRLADASPSSGGHVRILVPLTRREIADHLGITHETVSRSFTELKRKGVIGYDTPGDVRIEDMKALERLTGSR